MGKKSFLTPLTHTQKAALRLMRKQDRERARRGEEHRHPCPDANSLVTRSPGGDASSGNYITPKSPNPDDL